VIHLEDRRAGPWDSTSRVRTGLAISRPGASVLEIRRRKKLFQEKKKPGCGVGDIGPEVPGHAWIAAEREKAPTPGAVTKKAVGGGGKRREPGGSPYSF